MSEKLNALKALDAVATNVFYADASFNITYINEKALDICKDLEEMISQMFNVKVKNLVGTSIDIFHKNPKHQRKLLSNPKNFPIKSQIEFGGIILDLNISHIEDDSGSTEGYIVNWEDVTDLMAAEKTMQRSQQMVDKSPINTMMADPSGELLYMNENSAKTLSSLQALLPMKVDSMVGNSIDGFHKNPAHQRKIISNPQNMPHSAVIALGDQKLDLLVSAIVDGDGEYLGPMVTWDVITEKYALIQDLTEASQNLAAAAEELLSVSGNMAASAEETASQARNAGTAAEEVSSGVQTISASIDEMSASIKEITNATVDSSKKNNEALGLAGSANEVITTLGESSTDIGNVIKVITSIAQQTNLLALNATIEAARAGEAGKGFAVVANEVKELAKQTAQATEDISKKIETIQGDSQSAVSGIGDISTSIETLNNIAGNIAASVEEQAGVTNEVSRVVSESMQAVQSIAQNVNEVSEAAANTGAGAQQTQQAAQQLNDIANNLASLVKRVQVA